MSEVIHSCGVFLVSRPKTAWKGNEACWIVTASWSAAARTITDEVFICTTDGIYTPEQVANFPELSPNLGGEKKKSIFRIARGIIPQTLITLVKDYIQVRRKPNFTLIEKKVEDGEIKHLSFVWERHDVSSTKGYRLAAKYGVPYVVFVDAPIVWEAEKWGVKRPYWGKIIENKIEAALLKRADLTVCISSEVKDKMVSMGVEPARIHVAGNRVDTNLFNHEVSGEEFRQQYDLIDKTVIGWTGSFKKFHGLDKVVRAFHRIAQEFSEVVLVLVGDGLERPGTEQLVRNLGLSERVVFPGRRDFTEVPQAVAGFDIGLVSASTSTDFHYSPLKLREYLAMGKPSVVPRVPDTVSMFDEEVVLFYDVEDSDSLVDQIRKLVVDKGLRDKLRTASLKYSERDSGWSKEVEKVVEILSALEQR